MSHTLVPCPSCERHVRASEACCPFCSAEMPAGLARRVVPGSTQRLGRAATFVFGAAALVAASGCGAPATPDGGGGDDVVADNGGVMPLYGAPAPDGSPPGPDGGTMNDAAADAPPDDMGGPMPLYGGPPPDGGTTTDAASDGGNGRDGGIAPLYGGPPPRDGF